MAIINYSDLIADDGAFDNAIKKIEELEKRLKGIVKDKRQRIKVVSPEDIEGVKGLAKEIAKLKRENNNLHKSKEQLKTQKKKVSELNKRELIQLEKEREAKRKARLEAKAIAKVQTSEIGSIEKKRAELTLVTLAWGKLSEAERENGVRGKRLVASKKKLTEELKDLEKQTGDNRRNVGNYSDAVLKAVQALRQEKNEIKAGVNELKTQRKNVAKGSAEWVQYGRAIDQAEGKLQKINTELGETKTDGFNLDGIGGMIPNIGGVDIGGMLGGLGSASGGLGSILGMINPITAGIGLAVAGITAFGSHVTDLEKRFTKLRGEIQKTTGATGVELDRLTENTASLSTVFGDDENTLIRSQNKLMKAFKLNAGEAFDVIEKGYSSSANAQGDLLDNINEYTDQIKDAGGDADDLIRILDKSAKAGVFSDKGIDTVKEFGLAVREQTPATKKALEDAFGKKFAKKIFKGISEGSITSLEALELVSQKMNDSTIPAEKLQTVVADLFKGAGEDAGLDFLKSLKDITKETDNLLEATNPLVKIQKKQLKEQKELARSQQSLAREFTGLNSSISTFTTGSKIFINDFLTSTVKGFKKVGNTLGGFFNSIIELDGDSFMGYGKKIANTLLSVLNPALLITGESVFKLTEAEERAIEVGKLKNEIMEISGEEVAKQSQHYNNLLVAVNDNNITDKERVKLLNKINDLNPEILKGLVDQNNKITNLTEARKRLGQTIVANIYAKTKDLLLTQKMSEFTELQLKQVALMTSLEGKNKIAEWAKGIFTNTDTEKLDEVKDKIKSIGLQLKALNNGELDKAIKKPLLEIANSFKGKGASLFGDAVDESKERLNDAITKVEKLKIDIESTKDKSRLSVLKGKLLEYEKQLKRVQGSFDKTSSSYKKLLGLIEDGKNATKGVKESYSGGVGGGGSRKKEATELDLLEKIRIKRNELENEGLKQALENIEIRIDREVKGFEKLRAETEKQKAEGLIDVKEYERRISEINEISKLASKERIKVIANLRAKDLDDQQRENLKIFEEKLKLDILKKREDLRQKKRNEITIQDAVKDIQEKAIKKRIEILDNADKKREDQILKLVNKQKTSGLTEEEQERLKALEKIKGNEAEILALKVKNLKLTADQKDQLLADKLGLKKSENTGDIIDINRKIEKLKPKNGKKNNEAELLELKSLKIQRYNIEKKALEDEYAYKLSKAKENTPKYLKIQQDLKNELKKLENKHLDDLDDINEKGIEAKKESWKKLVDELGQVFGLILDKLENIYNKSVEKSEERLERQNEAVDRQRGRAEQGLSNTLTFEKKEMAKREAELVRANKRLERIQKVKALYSMYTANAGKSKDGMEALAKTLRDFSILEAITRGFKKGGYTGDYGTSQVAGVTHGQEFVIDAGETSRLGLKGKNMSDFKEMISNPLLSSYKDVGFSVEVLKSQKSEFVKETPKYKDLDTTNLENEIRELKEFQMSKPSQTVDVQALADGTLEYIERIVKDNTETTNRYRRKPRF